MSVMVNWDNDSCTRLCFSIEGRWTWQEFNWSWLECLAMMNSVSHTVDTIVDITKMEGVPLDLLTKSLDFVRTKSPNAGLSVVTTNSGFLKLLFESLKRIAPHESAFLRSGPNVESARQTLSTAAH